MLSVLKRLTPNVSVLLLKRLVDCFIFLVLVMISVTFYYQPARLFPLRHKIYSGVERMEAQSYWKFLSDEFSDDGFSFPRDSSARERFVTYEPPVGGWSEQLLAFENAVVVAKLLNRTLLAHPLIGEEEVLRVATARVKSEKLGTRHFLDIDPKYAVPLSSVLDLRYLARIIKVQVVRNSYAKFLQQLKNLTLHEVCHHDVAGFWVDFIPTPDNTRAWKVLEAQQFSPHQPLARFDHACDGELEITGLRESTPILRSILTELTTIQADVLSFKGRSLASHDLRFFSKSRVAKAQSWLLRYVRFSSYTQNRVERIVSSIKRPYNAIVISNDSNSEVFKNILNFRLKEMEKRQFRKVTKRLYVVTDLDDLSFLRPLEVSGYEIYSANKLIPTGINAHIRPDVIKLLGSLICKHARLFVGPLDSHLMQRARIHEARRKDGLLTEHISVRWAMHTMRRKFKILKSKNNKRENRNDHSTMIPNLRAMVCGMCKQMRKNLNNSCLKFIKQCMKI